MKKTERYERLETAKGISVPWLASGLTHVHISWDVSKGQVAIEEIKQKTHRDRLSTKSRQKAFARHVN